MDTSAGRGVGWWPRPQWQDEEEGEPLGGGSGRNLDRWNMSSSSEEMLEDAGLPEELKEFQGSLEEDDGMDNDLSELQDLESLAESEPTSPPSGHVKEGADIGRRSSVSPWHPQRDRQEEEEAWTEGSEGEPCPELSYEGLYGSEFSTSPEALKDPLALYNSHGKPSRFSSDGEEEGLSGNSKLTSPSAGSPPEDTPFERAMVGTRGQGGNSQDLLEEGALSFESQKSPEPFDPASPVGSIRWSCSPLGGLSLEDFRNSPSLDSEAFPESSWMENMAHPEGNGLEVAASSTVREPHAPKKLRQSRPDVREATGGAPNRPWGLTAEASRGLPTKIGRQSRSLSPQRTTSCRRTGGQGSNGSRRASPSTLSVSDPLPYGRGQLNHPLPDLSRVGPRVRFPRDPHSYHPPRGRTLPARSKDARRPVVFKSPAEIVREVLLSSGEGPPKNPPAAAISVIPEELKSPQQATELVKQLQEDYRKLLTKYAEAENTIDRLRLGAKVHLYADLPKPSHGVQMGTVPHASQVMTFSIPQIRAAEVTGRPGPEVDIAVNQGFSGQAGASASPSNPEGRGVPREDGFTSPDQPFSGEELTWALADQASKFWKQVESLEELIRSGMLTPQDQLKGFARLKGVQDALEQAYLQAREDHRQRQKHQDPEGLLGDFDPDRALEGEIFRQGMQLEELRERIEESSAQGSPKVASPPPSPFLPPDPQRQKRRPAASPQGPAPASHVPCPEADIPGSSRHGDQLDMEVSSSSEEPVEDVQGLPEPLRVRQQEVESGFEDLLDHYRSLKALPGSFALDQLHPDGEEVSLEEVDALAAGEAGRKDVFTKTISRNQGTPLSPSSMREPRPSDASRQRWPETNAASGHGPGAQREVPVSPASADKSRASASGPRRSPGEQAECCSDGIVGSSVPGSVTQEPFRKTNMGSSESPWLVPSEAHTERLGSGVGTSNHKHDLRMVSPETDSGFVGSEASRMSPLTQMPKPRPTLWRSHGALGRAAVAKGAALLVPRRNVPKEVEPSETDASPRHRLPASGLQRRRPALGRASHTRGPPWMARKGQPSGESTPTDSEAEGGLSAGTPPPEEMGRWPGPSDAAVPSPGQVHCSGFLDSRLERDQAIAALQNEVLHLRRSLEETLCTPRNPTTHPSSRRSWWRHVPQEGAARFSAKAKEMCINPGNSTTESAPSSPVMMEPEAWGGKPLVPPSEAQGNHDPSKPDDSTPKLQKGKEQETSVPRGKFSKPTVLRGPYTGAWYPLPDPKAQGPQAVRGPPRCSHSPGDSSQLQGGPTSTPNGQEAEGGDPQREAALPSQCPTQKEGDAKPCLLCKESGRPRGGTLQQAYMEQQQAHKSGAQAKLHGTPAAQNPGLWQTVATSIPCIPVVPYALMSSVVYSPLLATTSVASLAGLPAYDASVIRTGASGRQPRDDCNPQPLGGKAELKDLNRSLRHAMEAARDLKVTSHQMSRSLAWELSQAKSLRGSRLF